MFVVLLLYQALSYDRAGFGKYDSGSVGCVPTICSVNFFKGEGSISYTTYVEKKQKGSWLWQFLALIFLSLF